LPNGTDKTTLVTTNPADHSNQVKIVVAILVVTAVIAFLVYAFIKSRNNMPYFKDIQQDVELQSAKNLGTSFDHSIPGGQNNENKDGVVDTVDSKRSSSSDVGIAI